MRTLLSALALIAVTGSAAYAGEASRVYSWTDDEGVTHYGDSIPPEYAELDKYRVNRHGIPVETLEGRKSEEELAAEARERELEAAREAERRIDRALLATYLKPEEIINHRNRRIELFDAQARVTELFLRNLERRLAQLMVEASRYQPYSEDADAPIVDPNLVDEIEITRETIARHEANLEQFRQDKEAIMQKFDRDLKRFEELKGLTANSG